MPQNYGIAYDASYPGVQSDGGQKQGTTDRFGNLVVRADSAALVARGHSYRALGSGTPMTGIAQAITTSFSATAVPLVMVNGSATVRVVPQYIKLVCTATGASSTSSLYAISIDSANRYSSGGTDLSTFVFNANSALGPASAVSVIRFGTVTAAAAGGGTRYIANGSIKVQASPCWAIGDTVLFVFGEISSVSAQPMSGTTPIKLVFDLPPVVLGGQDDSLILHLWNVANATTAPSWAPEIGWLEL